MFPTKDWDCEKTRETAARQAPRASRLVGNVSYSFATSRFVDMTVRVLMLRPSVDCFVLAAPAVKMIVEKAVAASHNRAGVSVLELPRKRAATRDSCVVASAHSGCAAVSYVLLSGAVE
jgi:hypothetical protein